MSTLHLTLRCNRHGDSNRHLREASQNIRSSLHNKSNKTPVNRFFSKKRSGQAEPNSQRNAEARVRKIEPALTQQTSSGGNAPAMPTAELKCNLLGISNLQLYKAALLVVLSDDYCPACSKCATNAQEPKRHQRPSTAGLAQALITFEALQEGATANGGVAAIRAGLSIAQRVPLRDDGRMNPQIERKNQHEET
jgi:hypothetical protein